MARTGRLIVEYRTGSEVFRVEKNVNRSGDIYSIHDAKPIDLVIALEAAAKAVQHAACPPVEGGDDE